MKLSYQTTQYFQTAVSVVKVSRYKWIELEHSDSGSQIKPLKRERGLFPTPDMITSEGSAYFYPVDKVLMTYNKYNQEHRKKLTATVKTWFEKAASMLGWAEAIFLTDIQSKRSSGYMLRAATKKGSGNDQKH